MSFPISSRISAAVLTLLLVGCGNGGGGGGSAGGGPATPPALGTASMPGATLMVTKTAGTVGPGATITIRATSADVGIATVQMLVGTDWESATAATVVSPGPGIWDATVTLPSPLPAGSTILVRLSFTDGNVVESSWDAFPL